MLELIALRLKTSQYCISQAWVFPKQVEVLHHYEMKIQETLEDKS